MRHVTPMDLRRSLGRILDEASAGERILIERDHKPLAVLVSVEEAARLESDPDEIRAQRMAAVRALDEWRERYLASLPSGSKRPNAAELIRDDRDERTRRDTDRIPGHHRLDDR